MSTKKKDLKGRIEFATYACQTCESKDNNSCSSCREENTNVIERENQILGTRDIRELEAQGAETFNETLDGLTRQYISIAFSWEEIEKERVLEKLFERSLNIRRYFENFNPESMIYPEIKVENKEGGLIWKTDRSVFLIYLQKLEKK